MAMLQITTGNSGPRLHVTGAMPRPALQKALERNPGPVTVLIHGYRYQPGHPIHCPHTSLNSLIPKHPNLNMVSLPANLQIGHSDGYGIGLSYGWFARGNIWQAYRRAGDAGTHLAQLLAMIKEIDPARDIHIVAHSLGARVALRALSESAPGTVQRAVLMAAAEFRRAAIEALRSPGGYGCDVLHATSRENDLFDFILERLISAPEGGDIMLGHRLFHLPNLAHLQLDHIPVLNALSANGYPVAAPEHTVCHWSPYRRQGVFPLYRAFLNGDLTISELHHILPPDMAPRWSRLREKTQQRLSARRYFITR